MSDEEEWDKDRKPVLLPKSEWDGEDEEDNIKDNWDDDDEEENAPAAPTANQNEAKAFQVKKKTTLAEKIAEKERKQKELEEQTKSAKKQLTPQELYEAKQRAQKIQEEADLKLARETFGGDVKSSSGGTLDSMNPVSKEDFEEFEKALSERICSFEKSPLYPNLVEELIRNICVPLSTVHLKKLKLNVEAMCHEKLKTEKDKLKKGKPKTKARLHMEGDKDYTVQAAGEDDLYEDFM